jgi:hypothetical protein
VLTGSDLGRPAWSPDGSRLAVTDLGATPAEIEIVDLEGGGSETATDDVVGG